MEIGFFFWPYHVALVRAMAEAADTLGYGMVGIADTPGIAMDPWVATTLLAEGTRRARVAVCVTNLVTRQVRAARAAGVRRLMFTVSLAVDPLATVRLFGEKVLPAVRS